MTTVNVQKHTHQIPDDCKPLMSEAAYAALEANNLVIDIGQPVDFMLTHRLPFAAVYDQIPMINEREDRRHVNDYTCIKDNEFGKSNDETAQNVLARLGHSDASYWLVYVCELDEPNEDGLTKFFTLNPNGHDADKVHFAGFSWKPAAQVEADDMRADEQELEVLDNLRGIESWLNDMILGVTLRDADDGMYLVYYEALKKQGYLDKSAIHRSANYAKVSREHKDYQKRKAEYNTKTHVIPEKYEHLVSDESKAILAEQGLLIKVQDLPRYCYLTNRASVFGVDGYHPDLKWVQEHHNSGENLLMIDQDFLAPTVEETAEKVIATMAGERTSKSWCAIYQYEAQQPNEWGHTKIYTANVNDFPAGEGHLAAIVVGYNYDVGAFMVETPNQAADEFVIHESALAHLSDSEKADLLKSSQDDLQRRVNNSLFELELWANGTLVEVLFHRTDNGDYIYGYPNDSYRNTDAGEFNAQLQATIQKHIDDMENREANDRAFLKSVSAT